MGHAMGSRNPGWIEVMGLIDGGSRHWLDRGDGIDYGGAQHWLEQADGIDLWGRVMGVRDWIGEMGLTCGGTP